MACIKYNIVSVLFLFLYQNNVAAFSMPPSSSATASSMIKSKNPRALQVKSSSSNSNSSSSSNSSVNKDESNNSNNNMNNMNMYKSTSPIPALQKGLSTLALTAAITLSSSSIVHFNANAEIGYDVSNNNAEDTVELVIQSLKDATGDATMSFKVFETINDIITEGKGVGGSLSYKGVNLERGFVADEDTTIYNPGLSLLTESEKSGLVNAIIDNRKGNVASKTWNKENEFAFDSLKSRLDPLHMVELSPYLKAFPFLGGAMYLVALGVQQFARGIFEGGYIVSVLVVFIPVIALILYGV